MRTAIINARMLIADTWRDGQHLLVENGLIAALSESAFDCDITVDAAGATLCPGLIDLHVHGGGGYDFMDATTETVIGAAQAHLMGGTTTLLPTTVCSSDDEVHQLALALSSAKTSGALLPHMPGLHLEGPYFSKEQAGAQDPEYITIPSPERFKRLLEKAGDVARMSVAVELPGALELGDYLKEKGILAAIGHSNADYDEVLSAAEHGYTHVTHLYSGMSSLHRVGARRVLGVVESAYLIDELTVEIIADGIHLPPELLRLILKCKAHDKIILVTDALGGMGLPDGSEIVLGSKKNGRKAVVDGGVAYMPDRSCYAGSVVSAMGCVRTMVEKTGLTLAEALKMMTVNPARALKLQENKGSLQPGFDADLLLIDNNMRVQTVFVAGKMAVKNGKVLS
ncbi:MAG: N-acetylglucosamine-6-phosphate deacetylase [Eubacteriales bacterium]|nr:N-acetylglucosamine-6-phosphate deacetylase [Eubacteriales bacterium]